MGADAQGGVAAAHHQHFLLELLSALLNCTTTNIGNGNKQPPTTNRSQGHTRVCVLYGTKWGEGADQTRPGTDSKGHRAVTVVLL